MFHLVRDFTLYGRAHVGGCGWYF